MSALNGDRLTGEIDSAAVTRWLLDEVPGTAAPLSFQRIAGGRSNLTYLVTDCHDRRWVLRRPPVGIGAGSAHSMTREWDILNALKASSVTVPAAVALCTDHTVTGADFYLMEFVDGTVLDEHTAHEIPRDVRARLSNNMVDALAELHRVDCSAPSLEGYHVSGTYLDRQLYRWSTQLESRGSAPADLMSLHRRLVAHQPRQRWTGIVHGDYRPGNLLVGADGSVRGVLDWELWTIGDVLADLGWLVATWASRDVVGWAPEPSDGYLSVDDVVRRYSEVTGRDVSDMDYYHAFALWRLACIVEGVIARYRAGAMGAQRGDVDQLAARQVTLARRADLLLDCHA